MLSDNEGWFEKISYTASGGKNNSDADKQNINHLSVLINARVQTTPELLNNIVADAIHETMMNTGCRIITEKENSFKPGYPRPTHRMANT